MGPAVCPSDKATAPLLLALTVGGPCGRGLSLPSGGERVLPVTNSVWPHAGECRSALSEGFMQ